ncbi:hypothetical protein Dimus_029670, partial [Dionaea muscipula]
MGAGGDDIGDSLTSPSSISRYLFLSLTHGFGSHRIRGREYWVEAADSATRTRRGLVIGEVSA